MLLFFATTIIVLGFLVLIVLNHKRSVRWTEEDLDDNYQRIVDSTEQIFTTAVYMKFDR